MQAIILTKRNIAKVHRRIDAAHKLTTRIAKTFAIIGIKDLNVRGMVCNRRYARGVSDAGFYDFRRQLEYKARMYGSRVVVADRWYPSSLSLIHI